MITDDRDAPEHGKPLVDFAAILCSRLCHDLVSPVGAFANGIEILADEDDPDMRAEVLQLLETSARQTSNRLQFFRLAFGAAGGFGELVDLREAHKAVLALLSGGKIELDWCAVAEPVKKDAVKLLLNLALVASEALLRGGVLRIAMQREGGDLKVEIEASGDRLLLNEAVAATLRGGGEPHTIDPRAAPAYLAHLVASQLGAAIALVPPANGRLAVDFTVPGAF